ncbi:hypothetical protein [Psychrobacter sp. LV10R520-6]|uniref:hypothetical protein n=1 Tax=Psychrobacter sp. LV10R520-6 TaxID=1415574 RepID=UPI002AA0C0C6|nr:hypothetical protein [Psychrobacter sp. LV10R520-6]
MQSLKSIFTNALIALGLLFGLTLSAAATDFAKTEDLANQGYVNSQFSLGAMYEQGVGVDKDLFQAFK